MAATVRTSPEVHMSKRLKSMHSECPVNSDEGCAKRVRVTTFSQAEEVVNSIISMETAVCRQGAVHADKASAPAVVAHNEPHNPPLTLRKGLRVRLQGLDARPQLNGQTGQILGFHSAQSRWLVSFDNGSKKLVLSSNLQPEGTATATSSTHGSCIGETALAKTNGCSSRLASDITLAVPSKDVLKSSLETSRGQALRRVEEVSGNACAEVSQLRADVQQLCRMYHQQLLQYCAMSKPANYKDQCARNSVRKDLWEVAQTLQPKMQRLFDASKEPAACLSDARLVQLNAIDDAVNALLELRRDTVEICDEYEAKIQVDYQAAQAGMAALVPGIESVDKFMQCCAQEVQREKIEADRVHQELVDRLEKEEAQFVCANDSPSRSPLFAKVQEDLAACRRLIEEHASDDASSTSFMQLWESMLKALPSKKEPEPEPQKRRFWGRLKCASRTVPSSV